VLINERALVEKDVPQLEYKFLAANPEGILTAVHS
jgi:hypothetical protein